MVDNLLFDSREHDSFDLGWLLHNPQVSDERLCSYLLSETSPQIERLVARFIKPPDERMAALEHILLGVLQRRRQYKNNITGKAWLYRLIVEECLSRTQPARWIRRRGIQQVLQSIDTRFVGEGHFNPFLNSLDDAQRLFAVLHYDHHLSAEEIAVALKINPGPVQTGLEQVRQLLMAHRLGCTDCETRHSTLKGMETALFEALQPVDEPSREASPEQVSRLLEHLVRKKKNQHTRQWAGRVFEGGLALLLLVIGEWAISHSGSLPSWFSEPTQTAAVQVAVSLPTAQPEPAPAPLPAPAAAAQKDDSDEIHALILAGLARWDSLWADVEVKTYLVENYSDGSGSLPGKSMRKQIWLNLQGYSRVISGPLTGSPDSTYAIYRNQIFGHDFNSGQSLQGTPSELIPDADLKKIFSPSDMFAPGGHFNRIGSDQVAGRPAWVLDWSIAGRRAYRYWIDKYYGVVLRRLEFDNSKFQPVFAEVAVTKIYFETGFSAALFAPGRYKGDHFAIDFSGNPEIPDLKSGLQAWSNPLGQVSQAGPVPSAGFSLAGSHRSFFNGPTGWMKDAGTPHLVLYADKFDFSQLILGGKSILACERSPDGARIAYNSPPQAGSGDTSLLVADLASVQSARLALPDGITSGDFAFSPDARRLAFFGCEKSSGFCGVFILELASGKLTRTLPLTYADYITWSPDGRSIALVGNDDSSGHSAKLASANLLLSELMALLHTWHFQVMDADSGSLTYKKQFEWFDLSAPPDSPTQHWDKPFKVSTLGVKGCTPPS